MSIPNPTASKTVDSIDRIWNTKGAAIEAQSTI
jgi:hypothetical protein